MAQITVTAGDIALTSKRSGNTWSKPSWPASFALNLPKYSIVDSAVLSFAAGSPICGGSSITADGQRTGAGRHSINIAVANEAQARDVTFTFSGSGTSYSTSITTITEISLTVVYHVKNPCPFQRVESGALVKYRLYRAEGGSFVPYNVCKAEGGALIKY